MFAVLFLSCEILLKWFGYLSRTFLFSTLERITIKQIAITFVYYACMHTCINISICHVSGIKSMSICHASDTGQNYLSKKCFLQSWSRLLLLWHFPLLSDIFKRGFHALESYCIQRKENDNIITLFPCFLRKKLFFFLSGFYTFKKKQLLSLINLFCGKTYCDVLMQHSSITYKFWSSVTVTMPWIEFHVLW